MESEGYNQEKVIKECKKGNIASQRQLYRHYYSYAMSICLRYTENKETAEEVLNDSFLKVFKNMKKYDDSYSFKSWLRKIIINTAVDHYRRNLKYIELLLDTTKNFHNCKNKAIDNLMTEDILVLLRNLKTTHRLVFNLYEIEGYSHKEIAALLDITEGTSRSYLKRAKEKLRILYKHYFNDTYE